MDLEAFQARLAGLFGGDLRADHPVDRRFRDVVADVPGMATEHKLALLNLAAAHLGPGEAYLEVGSFKGLSLIGAMLGNPGRFYAIENFLEFNPDGTARAELEANLARWAGPGPGRGWRRGDREQHRLPQSRHGGRDHRCGGRRFARQFLCAIPSRGSVALLQHLR